MTVSQWADSYRRLSPEASAEPGRWATARAEYQRGIMDAFSDPEVEQVVVMSSAQVGKTEIELNIAGYHIHQDPAPILVVHPTIEMGEAWSKDRLAPMLRDTPALQGKVKDPRARDSGNTLRHKAYPGGHITIAGANSPASLASRPIRVVLCDELDRFPQSAGTEGDPVSLAIKRAATFHNRVIGLVSTPTIKGASRIEAAYETSDKRQWHVPCPDCGHGQPLRWQQVRWTDDDPDTAVYVCEECGGCWDDARRWAAIRAGGWQASAPFRGIAGFHLSELVSTWRRLRETVSDFLRAKDSPEQLKTWVNTALGETWQDRGEAPDWERVYERREPSEYGLVPAGALTLTGGVDVQKDRLELYVWGWGRRLESWLVDRIVLQGDPSSDAVWRDLTEVLQRSWRHEIGGEVPIQRVAVDTGYATQEVYAWSRRPGVSAGQVMAVKGVDSQQTALGTPTAVDVGRQGKKARRGARVWPVGVGLLKREFYGWIRQPVPTEESEIYARGFVHIPDWADREICQQLVAEQLVTLRSGRQEWQKLRERNEALDCRVYARAAAIAIGIDRYTDDAWDQLQAALEPGGVVRTRSYDPPEGREKTPAERAAQGRRKGRGQQGWLGGRGGGRGGWL